MKTRSEHERIARVGGVADTPQKVQLARTSAVLGTMRYMRLHHTTYSFLFYSSHPSASLPAKRRIGLALDRMEDPLGRHLHGPIVWPTRRAWALAAVYGRCIRIDRERSLPLEG